MMPDYLWLTASLFPENKWKTSPVVSAGKAEAATETSCSLASDPIEEALETLSVGGSDFKVFQLLSFVTYFTFQYSLMSPKAICLGNLSTIALLYIVKTVSRLGEAPFYTYFHFYQDIYFFF
jgi:hypothetical protein